VRRPARSVKKTLGSKAGGHESEARYRNLFETLIEGFWRALCRVIDADDRCLSEVRNLWASRANSDLPATRRPGRAPTDSSLPAAA